MFTFHSTYALDSVADLHVVALERHEDSIGVVRLSLRVNLGVAVLELEPVVAVVLRHLAVHLEVLLDPAEGQVYLSAVSAAFDCRLIVDQAVDIFILDPRDQPDDGRGLWRLRRVLLAADAGVPHPGTGRHQGGAGQEAQGGVTGAAVPQQHRDECEEGADDDEGLVVHPSSQAAHGHDSPARHETSVRRTRGSAFVERR